MDKSILIGRVTPGGWTIVSVREPGARHSGGCHSLGYVATNAAGEYAFVKALDMRLRLKEDADLQAALETLSVRIERFTYEWGLAQQCNGAGLSGVIRALEQGAFTVEGEDNPVPY